MDRHKGIILPGEHSNSQTKAPASSSEAVPKQLSIYQVSAPVPGSETVPVTSSNIQTSAPSTNVKVIPGQSSNSQDNAPVSISEADPGQRAINAPASISEVGQSSQNQTVALASNSVTIPPIAGPSTLRSENDTSEPTKTHPKNDQPEEEPDEVREWRRQLAYYKEMYDRTYGQREEERSEGASNQMADKTTSDMSSQDEGASNQMADKTTCGMSSHDLLMKLGDATLGSILSTLMCKCNPPQREYPFKGKCPPPWWPKGNESWWGETGKQRPEPGQLPYKKPHDMTKEWKAITVLSAIKNLAPNFELIVKSVKASKNLQDRLNAAEMEAWNSALKEEMKIYCRGHPDVPLSDLLKTFQSYNAVVLSPRGSNRENKATSVVPQQMPREEMSPRFNQERSLRFTCANIGCFYHNNECGFKNTAARDRHQLTCKYQSPKNQFVAPADTRVPFTALGSTSQEIRSLFGNISQVTTQQVGSTSQLANVQNFGSTSQGIAPPFRSHTQVSDPMHPPQQMIPTSSQSMITPVDTSVLLEMYRQNLDKNLPEQDWEPFDASGSNYQSALTGSLHMGQRQPGFGRFYSGPGSSGGGGGHNNNGSYMQMLNDMQPNSRMMPLQQQIHGADPSLYQHLTKNFNFGGDNSVPISNNVQPDAMHMPPPQQHHDADPSFQQSRIENFHYGGGEGLSTGMLQQTGFRPVENTEIQFFHNNSAVETGTSNMQTSAQFPERTQFGQIGPLDSLSLSPLDSLPHSQYSSTIPSISIPQASEMPQNAPQDVQTSTPEEGSSHYGTGSDELVWDWTMFK